MSPANRRRFPVVVYVGAAVLLLLAAGAVAAVVMGNEEDEAGGQVPQARLDEVLKTALFDPAKELLGQYACTFTQGQEVYPPFPCVIERRGAKLWLEKLAGSQRIRGEITTAGDGFRFAGSFYCPVGDCTQSVGGDFTRKGAAGFEGRLDDESETKVTLERSVDP